jgi:hypothetical protein
MKNKCVTKSLFSEKTNKSLFSHSFLQKPELKKQISEQEKMHTKLNPNSRNNKKRNTIKATLIKDKTIDKEIHKKKLTVDFHYNRKDLASNHNNISLSKISTETSTQTQSPRETGSVFNIIEVIHSFSKVLTETYSIFDNIDELFNETQGLKFMFPIDMLWEENNCINKEIQENSIKRINQYQKIFDNCNLELNEITHNLLEFKSLNKQLSPQMTPTNHKHCLSMHYSINSSRNDTLKTKDSETRVDDIIPEEDVLNELDLINCFDCQDKISQLPRPSKWTVRKQDDCFENLVARRDKRFNTLGQPRK